MATTRPPKSFILTSDAKLPTYTQPHKTIKPSTTSCHFRPTQRPVYQIESCGPCLISDSLELDAALILRLASVKKHLAQGLRSVVLDSPIIVAVEIDINDAVSQLVHIGAVPIGAEDVATQAGLFRVCRHGLQRDESFVVVREDGELVSVHRGLQVRNEVLSLLEPLPSDTHISPALPMITTLKFQPLLFLTCSQFAGK